MQLEILPPDAAKLGEYDCKAIWTFLCNSASSSYYPVFTLGIDYGTNSVRALVVRCADGAELGSYVVTNWVECTPTAKPPLPASR